MSNHRAIGFCGFLVWLLLLGISSAPSFAAKSSEKRYVVKKNDTLSGIAQMHGVTVTVLMKHNGLKDANQIHPGKVIRIPPVSTAPNKPVLDRAILKLLNETRIVPKKWRYVVIHHSATDSGNAESMDRYHRRERHMENGLAYHFVIGNGRGMPDGEIAIGRRWTDQIQGGHLASEELNEKSIGICLVGNFDDASPTQKQMANLQALLHYLLRSCRLGSAAVKTHQQINPIHTRCPGQRFPAKTFLKELQLQLIRK